MEKDTFTQAKKNFMDPDASTSKILTRLVVDIIYEIHLAKMRVFLHDCINIFHNKKVVNKLQTLIYNCTEKYQPQMEQRVVNKIHKNKIRTG